MSGLDITFAAAGGAGIISFLSPCVLPLVPAYLCFVAGTSLDQVIEDGTVERAMLQRVTLSALAFVLGFSTVFVLMGASASAINQLIIEYIDVVAKIAGAVIVLFGLHFMGVLKIPFLYREVRFNSGAAPTGLVGAYVIGLAFAFGWTPCVGPILATILTIAASRDSLGYGVSLLAVYALGLGIPFLIAAVCLNPFMSFLQRFRRHIRKVEIGTGALLALTGVLIFTNALSSLGFYLLELFPVLGTIG
ncbi:MAG: cytochrome C biogenesis protein [Alphaproteobacteria bacterium]|nr:cytochrome C biogenesis protein [Alphaproteobacteria bacterium]|tara:strand:+ start:4965 stop:5708 length:744 start_codon:yes stop_codon:yes gene_type:complete